jgi:FkbM family methyltransferase
MSHNKPRSLAESRLDERIHKRFFREPRPGRVLIEVGAARPDYLSISAYFRDMGWNIIAIEPNPAFCELYTQAGIPVLRYACGDRDEENVDFTIVDSQGTEYRTGAVSFEAFSSLGIRKAYADLKPSDVATKTIKVQLRKLDTILAKHAPNVNRVDVLAVDVEGWELDVLAGFDLARYRPVCVVLENLFADRKYLNYMKQFGYRRWRVLPPNDIYVAPDCRVGLVEVLGLRFYDYLFHTI